MGLVGRRPDWAAVATARACELDRALAQWVESWSAHAMGRVLERSRSCWGVLEQWIATARALLALNSRADWVCVLSSCRARTAAHSGAVAHPGALAVVQRTLVRSDRTRRRTAVGERGAAAGDREKREEKERGRGREKEVRGKEREGKRGENWALSPNFYFSLFFFNWVLQFLTP